ncbi:MAG: MFS transporter [Thaumarchaeota archaeon]|nr:MFS transporter [Nitrososphaerota archaeon]MDG6905515.1 MFS transporter [Nitrososphaerota archaeon]
MNEVPRPESNGEEKLTRWTILSVTTLSAFMAALDTNIVTIALPKIADNLSSGVSQLGWVITGYILATAIFLLQSGKIGDRYGKKRIYLIGFAIFGVASALCGLSQSIYELISFRIIQGIGASVLSATTVPLIFDSFPAHERGAAVGVNSISWAIGAIAGPVLGGFIVTIDWRLIFYINVPIAAAAILIGTRRIPSRLNKSRITGGINPVSSLLLGIAVAMVMLWLTFFDYRFALASLAFLFLLFLSEYKAKSPLLNREIVKSKGFVYCTSGISILQIAFLGVPFAMSFYYQSIVNLSPIATGLYIAPLPLAMVIANPVAGRLSDRLKAPVILVILGAILEGVGTMTLGLEILGSPSPVYIALSLISIGTGGAFVWSPMINSALRFVKSELRGVANGTMFTLINIGFAASIAVVIGVSASFLPPQVISQIYLGQLGNLSGSAVTLFEQGIAKSLLGLSVVNLIALPLLLLARREQKRSKTEMM